jgi:hypothetical protein
MLIGPVEDQQPEAGAPGVGWPIVHHAGYKPQPYYGTAVTVLGISPGQYHSAVRALDTGTGPDRYPPIFRLINAHLLHCGDTLPILLAGAQCHEHPRGLLGG